MAEYDRDVLPTVVFEVKPIDKLRADWVSLRPGFKAAVAHCRLRDWQFKIVTERHIRTPYGKREVPEALSGSGTPSTAASAVEVHRHRSGSHNTPRPARSRLLAEGRASASDSSALADGSRGRVRYRFDQAAKHADADSVGGVRHGLLKLHQHLARRRGHGWPAPVPDYPFLDINSVLAEDVETDKVAGFESRLCPEFWKWKMGMRHLTSPFTTSRMIYGQWRNGVLKLSSPCWTILAEAGHQLPQRR